MTNNSSPFKTTNEMTRMKNYCFTYNNPTTLPENDLKDYKYLIYQREKGEEGTIHFQGYVCFKKQIRITSVKNMSEGASKYHFEPRNGTHSEARDYCKKQDETYLEGPWVFGDDTGIPEGKGDRTDLKVIKRKIESGTEVKDLMKEDEHLGSMVRYYKYFEAYSKMLKGEKAYQEFLKDTPTELRPWQKEAVEELDTQDDRMIDWYVDEVGGKGKTALSKWLIVNKKAFYCRGGKSADIAYAFDYQEYVVFDFTREAKEFINYSVIEAMKDGLLWCPKFESKMMKFTSRKVIVFSNFEPHVDVEGEPDKISKNRLNIYYP